MAFYTRRRQFRAPGKLIEIKSLKKKNEECRRSFRFHHTHEKKGIIEEISLMRSSKS